MKKLSHIFCLLSAAVLLPFCYCLSAAESSSGGGAVLRVGVAPVSPPMVYKQGKEIVGVEADFAAALGRELNRPIKFVELDFDKLIDALNENKIDIIMSSLSITKPRQFRLAFSDPYLRIGQMALVRAEDKFRYTLIESGLANHNVGLRKGTTGDQLVQQEFSRAKRKYFKSGEEATKALSSKSIDLYVDDSTVIWYLSGAHEAKGLVVSPIVLSDELLGWGMRRADTGLQAMVNAYLKKAMASGESKQILRRWIPNFQ